VPASTKITHNIRIHLTGYSGFARFRRQVMRGDIPIVEVMGHNA
jgi:hypothetical protein